MQHQLVAVQGTPQPAKQRQPPRAVLIHRRVVDHESGMGLLGDIHGDVGVLQQLGGVAAVLGVDRDPDAGIQVQPDPSMLKGCWSAARSFSATSAVASGSSTANLAVRY